MHSNSLKISLFHSRTASKNPRSYADGQQALNFFSISSTIFLSVRSIANFLLASSCNCLRSCRAAAVCDIAKEEIPSTAAQLRIAAKRDDADAYKFVSARVRHIFDQEILFFISFLVVFVITIRARGTCFNYARKFRVREPRVKLELCIWRWTSFVLI